MRHLINTAALSAAFLACACGMPASDAESTQYDPPAILEATESSPVFDMSHIAKWKEGQQDWFAPVEPFNIIGDVYFVGTKGLAMFLIAGDAGHIVIDGGMPGQGQYVADQITALGFDPADVKILLNTHAHLDHSGGLAMLKTITGAKLLASEGDRSALEGGFYLGSEEDDFLKAPPVPVDQIISDRERVALGNITLTANLTPGHSRGCTSWTLKSGGQDVLIFCSATVAGNSLINPLQYEGIVSDYRQTFEIARDWNPDVFLSNHPQFFDFDRKRAAQIAGHANAFVDDEDFPKFLSRMARKFEADFQKQKRR